jgi:hypothetical protein
VYKSCTILYSGSHKAESNMTNSNWLFNAPQPFQTPCSSICYRRVYLSIERLGKRYRFMLVRFPMLRFHPPTTSAVRAHLPTSLSKLCCPVFILLQSLFAHTRPNGAKTSLEVAEFNRPDLIHRHVKQCLSQGSERAHGSVLCECRNIRAGEAYIDNVSASFAMERTRRAIYHQSK